MLSPWGPAAVAPLPAIVVALLPGCGLLEMAKFSYHNARSAHAWDSREKVSRVPFTLINEHIVVPVRVNGSAPLKFVLDSGAAATVIMESHGSRQLPLVAGGEIELAGAGTGFRSVANIVNDTELSVGTLRLLGQSVIRVPLSSMPFFDSLDEVYFDGVIGYDFLRRFVTEIDHERGEVVFYEPEAFAARGKGLDDSWQELPLDIVSSMPYLETLVDTGAGSAVAVRVLVDTGSTGALSLVPANHEQLEAPGRYYRTYSQGLTGKTTYHSAMANGIHLGQYQLAPLLVNYSMTGGYSEGGSHGILGNRLLSRFNLIFNYEARQLWLKPNQRFALPVGADRSGLRILPHARGAIVKSVAPATAGAALGLEAGNVITEFEGRPVTTANLARLQQALQSQRRKIALCWLEEAKRRCGTLSLASRFQPAPEFRAVVN